MSQTSMLWLLAFSLLAGGAILTSAAPPESALSKEEVARFVSRGYFILAKTPLLPRSLASNAEGQSKIYREGTECKITCNDEPLEAHECTGRAEVRCVSVPEQQAGNNTQRVDVYTRRCDGGFMNETHQMAAEYDTSQACKGLSTLTMKTEHLEEETGEWVTDYSFKKTCATRFAMTVMTTSYPGDLELEETQVATLCDGASSTYADNPDDSRPEAHESSPTSTVTCNDKPSDWGSPCNGVFLSDYTNGDTEAVTKCVGRWTPYVANWECVGDYTFTHDKSPSSEGTNALERQCTGTALISTILYTEGYQLCNGESKFNEMYTTATIFAT